MVHACQIYPVLFIRSGLAALETGKRMGTAGLAEIADVIGKSQQGVPVEHGGLGVFDVVLSIWGYQACAKRACTCCSKCCIL
jgi:hypothetical protein